MGETMTDYDWRPAVEVIKSVAAQQREWPRGGWGNMSPQDAEALAAGLYEAETETYTPAVTGGEPQPEEWTPEGHEPTDPPMSRPGSMKPWIGEL